MKPVNCNSKIIKYKTLVRELKKRKLEESKRENPSG